MKRIVLLTAMLAVGLYASEWLVGWLLGLIPASMFENPWAGWLALAVPLLVAAWLIGRWRGLAGRRLALTAAASMLAAFAIAAVIALAAMSLPQSWAPGFFRGEAASAFVYLVIAVEAVALSWVFAGLAPGLGAHRTSAST
jgi:hypothetical protein